MPAQQMVVAGTICVFCADVLTDETRSENDENICASCTDEHMVWCESCERMGFNDNAGRPRLVPGLPDELINQYRWLLRLSYMHDSGEWRCGDCLYSCQECDNLFSYEEDSWNCCDDEARHIHDYSYRPMLRFWHSKDGWTYEARLGMLYMGMEIETERARPLLVDWEDVADEEYGAEAFIYAKSDGSLHENGVEFVTHPATLEAIRDKFPWKSFEFLQQNGARAWAMETCGMHVHLSRSAFTPTHLWKFIKFQYYNAHNCVRFAGRDSQQWASWSNETMQETAAQTAKVVKNGRPDYHNRYTAINMLPRNTIELRYFRPNLLKPGVLRVVEFIDAMYNYTKQMTVQDVILRNALRDWEQFVNWLHEQPQYENASAYIKGGNV